MILNRFRLFTGCLAVTFLFGGAGLCWSQEEESIDTLDIIEIPGTVVQMEKRPHVFPEPDLQALSPFPDQNNLQIPAAFSIKHHSPAKTVALDPIAQKKGIRSSVKPVRVERPPYPRFAREQGWEGTVILRLVIDQQGKVATAKTQKSSGYPILDESAAQAVQQWAFQPAKNGEFPVSSKVDLPIRFDLDE